MDTAKRSRDFIYELREKINFLKENSIARGVCGHGGSLNSIAQVSEIAWKTFNDGVNAGALNSDCQRKLAQHFDFPLDWPEWNDPVAILKTPKDGRRDTADAFATRYRERHKPGNGVTKIPLRCLILDTPEPTVESLGSVEIVPTQQFLDKQDGTLSAVLICRAANLEDVRIAVRFCKLRLLRAPESKLVDRRLQMKSIAPINNDKGVEVTIQRVGTGQRQTFEITAKSGAIEFVSLPDDLWHIDNAREGDQFEAQLIVYLRDCALVTSDDDARPVGNEVRPEDGNSFIRPGYDRLGKALPLIQKRYEELRLSDGEQDWAMLHRFAVQLVKVNDEA